MNNPLRALSLRFEAKKLRAMSPADKLERVLEVGCGEGTGAKQILRYWQPKYLDAIDLDPKMIARAKRRVGNENVVFRVGDVADLSFAANNTYDAVFDFGILHHVPNWQDAINELLRVLKPGGLLYIEDGSIEAFTKNRFGRFLGRILDHPYAQMYTKPAFEQQIGKIGFQEVNSDEIRSVGIFWKVLREKIII